MSQRFDPDVHQFVREHVEGRTCRELTQLVNEHFGANLFTEATMKGYKNNHHLKSDTPRGRTRQSKFGDDVEAFIRENASGRSRTELVRMINEQFGKGTMTLKQVQNYMSNHKIQSGVVTRFRPGHVPTNKGKKGVVPPAFEKTLYKKGHRADNAAPIGTEKKREDGYVYVKVRDGEKNRNWITKHRLVWEQAHGPIPTGHKIIFLDGNRNNFALENLALVSDAEHGVMCKRGLHFERGELTQTGILLAKVVLAANRKTTQQHAQELRRLVRVAIEKTGEPIELELNDGGKVRRVRINQDGSLDKLWKE